MLLSPCSKNSEGSFLLSALSLSSSTVRGNKIGHFYWVHNNTFLIMCLVFVLTSFRGVDFILLCTCECVHTAMRESKPGDVVFPAAVLRMCIYLKSNYVTVRVRYNGRAQVVSAGTPTNRRLIFLLIHKCQRGSLWQWQKVQGLSKSAL